MMTNDRDDMTADRSVSATYHELADERAPAGLDEQVLRRAAAQPRTGSFFGGGWMKPVAWAATIGLSLAIVLELTQVPQAPLEVDFVTPVTDERRTPAPASVEPAAPQESRGTKPARHRSETGAVEESEARAMAPTTTTAPVPAAETSKAKVQAHVPAPEPAEPQAAESTDLQPRVDRDMTSAPRGDAVTGAAFAARANRLMLEQPNLCPETVREVAEDWYRCIEAQRNNVPAARVDEELEEFRNRFPDFQVSDTE